MARGKASEHLIVDELLIEILRLEGTTKYLGRLMSFNDPHGTEIDNRIKAAWKAFFANKEVLCIKKCPPQTETQTL